MCHEFILYVSQEDNTDFLVLNATKQPFCLTVMQKQFAMGAQYINKNNNKKSSECQSKGIK